MPLDRNDHSQHLRIVVTHVAIKCFQAGTLIAPIVVTLRHRRNLNLSKLLSGTWKGAFFTSTLSLPMCYMRLHDQNDEQIFNRAYRLTHNRSQIRVDNYSFIGAGIGALTTALLIRQPVQLIDKLLGGAAFGILGGMIAHLAQGDLSSKVPNAMIQETKDMVEDLKNKKN